MWIFLHLQEIQLEHNFVSMITYRPNSCNYHRIKEYFYVYEPWEDDRPMVKISSRLDLVIPVRCHHEYYTTFQESIANGHLTTTIGSIGEDIFGPMVKTCPRQRAMARTSPRQNVLATCA